MTRQSPIFLIYFLNTFGFAGFQQLFHRTLEKFQEKLVLPIEGRSYVFLELLSTTGAFGPA